MITLSFTIAWAVTGPAYYPGEPGLQILFNPLADPVECTYSISRHIDRIQRAATFVHSTCASPHTRLLSGALCSPRCRTGEANVGPCGAGAVLGAGEDIRHGQGG